MTPQVLGRLSKIEKRFVEFDNQSALIKSSEKTAVKWLKSVLLTFYEIGIFAEGELIRNPTDVTAEQVIHSRTKIIEFITRQINFFAHNISVYCRREIDFIDDLSKEVPYKVRSGIEFLLTELAGISPEFDLVLEKLRVLSSVEDEFDGILKDWIETGLHYPLREGDLALVVVQSTLISNGNR